MVFPYGHFTLIFGRIALNSTHSLTHSILHIRVRVMLLKKTLLVLWNNVFAFCFSVYCYWIYSTLFFRHLRKGRAQQTLFNLALAMLCFLIVFVVGIEQTHDFYGCIVVAVLLHYFILVSFMWMLMEGILQYLRFVKVLGTYIPHFILKTAVPAWGKIICL